jgi:peptidyl-prolyl cis-trans isomerase SurA
MPRLTLRTTLLPLGIALSVAFGFAHAAETDTPKTTSKVTPAKPNATKTAVAPSLVAPATPGASVQLDRIVAIVNDDVITERELLHQMALISNQIRTHKRPLPPTDVLMPQVLDQMITQMAELQLAKRAGISVDDLTLDTTLRGIANDNSMSIEQFRDALSKEGTSWGDFREQIRREITINRLQKHEVIDRIQISDKEIDEAIKSKLGAKSSGQANVEYHVRQILIALPESATPDDIAKARSKAENTLQALRAGGDFAALAASVSGARDALEGGDLGWRNVDSLPSIYASIVVNMQPGQVSELIRSPSGFHIIQLEESRGTSTPQSVKLTETHARHILIQTSDTINDDEARRRLEDIRQRLAKGESFATLAKTYSNDKGSAERGGDLGWARAGMMVPEFEQVMNSTPVNQVSAPFRTQYGWHILQVLETRDASGDVEFLREQTRQSLMRLRVEEEIERWQRRIRDEAYTEIMLGADAKPKPASAPASTPAP